MVSERAVRRKNGSETYSEVALGRACSEPLPPACDSVLSSAAPVVLALSDRSSAHVCARRVYALRLAAGPRILDGSRMLPRGGRRLSHARTPLRAADAAFAVRARSRVADVRERLRGCGRVHESRDDADARLSDARRAIMHDRLYSASIRAMRARRRTGSTSERSHRRAVRLGASASRGRA